MGGGEREREGWRGADLAKQVTRSRGTIALQVLQAPGTPHYLPRPSASPTQVTRNLGLPRPPSSGGPSPFEKRSCAPWAGTAPGELWFPQNKSGQPTPCPVPWSLAEATGCVRTSRSDSGTRDRPTDRQEQGPSALHPTPGGVPPADRPSRRARGRSYRVAAGRAGGRL